MSLRGSVHCAICTSQNTKYSCPSCLIPYCSVKCFKEHKADSCSESGLTRTAPALDGHQPVALEAEHKAKLRLKEEDVPDKPTLKPLISLKWPYISEEPSYADPLKRDEPKPLQLHHYEAIATSSEIRSALSSNPTLPPLLRRLDKLRGTEREEALERLLGVATDRAMAHGQRAGRRIADPEEDAIALKQLAEAVEKSVRGEKADALGLDWTEES